MIADGLSSDFEANLEEAATCWNLATGTQFVVGSEATATEQQVEVFYDRLTCLHALAQVQGGWPIRIGICPEEYWGTIASEPIFLNYQATPFRALSHELGHVLNIIGHPDEPFSVMGRPGTAPFFDMFSSVDMREFAGANPGFEASPACGRVVRAFRPGAGTEIGHCACDDGPFDLDRPIVIVPAPGVSATWTSAVAAAVDCWNLHHGIQLGFGAPAPDDQIAYVEPGEYLECGTLTDLDNLWRAQDGSNSVMCAARPDSPLREVGRILGVQQHYGNVGPPFSAEDDAQFAAVYPGRSLACRDVQLDPLTMICACAD